MKAGVFISALCVSVLTLAACEGEPNIELETTPAPKAETEPEKLTLEEALVSENWDGLIGEARRYLDVPAIGGVIFKDGEILDQGVHGTKTYFGKNEIAATDLWHIGSITKSMTATMIARLVERDILRWDETLSEIFGPDIIHAGWQGVTLKELLTHSSGAEANFPTEIMLKYPKAEAEILLERKQAVLNILSKAPNEKSTFLYSNVGYTIAGHIAEHKSGMGWEALMRAEVFEPLGLRSAGFGAPQAQNEIPPIRGHRGKLSMDPTGLADNSPIIGPAGTVHMSLQDLAKFGQAHLNGLKGEMDYLTKETFEILHKAILNDYAMGWVEVKPETLPVESIFWHNGSNTMWYALLMAVPEDNMVYALATNTGTVEKIDPVFNRLIKKHLTAFKETEKE